VQTANASFGAELSEFTYCKTIDPVRLCPMLLAPVNICGCSGIDQQIEGSVFYLGSNRSRQVQFPTAERQNVIGIGKPAAKGSSKSAILAENCDPLCHPEC
jgi:hypothetical protein